MKTLLALTFLLLPFTAQAEGSADVAGNFYSIDFRLTQAAYVEDYDFYSVYLVEGLEVKKDGSCVAKTSKNDSSWMILLFNKKTKYFYGGSFYGNRQQDSFQELKVGSGEEQKFTDETLDFENGVVKGRFSLMTPNPYGTAEGSFDAVKCSKIDLK